MFDHSLMAAALDHPGADPRQWISYATVDPSTPGAPNLTFTTEYGPLVNVTLHPSGIPAVCRVAHEIAGNGEGEWYPFVDGDEVLVAIPEGDEKAGCVVIGRLNQEIDAWPQKVAGAHGTQNRFGFRRRRAPYVIETAASYLIRSAVTKASIGISADGSVQIVNGDKAFMAIRPDFVGLQSGDASTLIQIDVAAKQAVLEANGTKLTLDGSSSSLYTTGTLQLGTAGQQASEHAKSVESVVVLLQAFFTALGAASPGALTGAGLAAAFTGVMNTALPAAALLPITPYTVALTIALQAPKIAGVKPGVAAPGLLI